MDRDALARKFDRLVALRGDPTKGVPATEWAQTLEGVDPDLLLRAGIDAVRQLLLQEWEDRRPADKRPREALDAAESWLKTRSADAVTALKAASKACTAARNETFGDDHRVPEAARAVARAAQGKDIASVFEALACVEHELLARIALMSEFHRGPEQRRALVDVVRKVVLPPESEPKAPAAPVNEGPVRYTADGRFSLGQTLIHKTFGDVKVVEVGETWVQVELADGTKKRLAQGPRPPS